MEMIKYGKMRLPAGEDEAFMPIRTSASSAFSPYDHNTISTLSPKLGANVTPVTSPSIQSSGADTTVQINPEEDPLPEGEASEDKLKV